MKDRTILAIKGLAIIGVVFHHLVNRREDPHAVHWVVILLHIFHWCVLAFMCVSGYLHALSDSRRVKSVGEFALLRFNRLLVPFFCLVFGYALIWQTLQLLHVPGIGAKIPPGFIDKIAVSFWPVAGPHEPLSVGEQLYYLPLLFGVSFLFVLVHRVGREVGLWVLAAFTFLAAVRLPANEFTGFSLVIFLWSIFFYTGGYLLYCHRQKVVQVRVALIACTVLLYVFGGHHYGLIRCVPFWLVAEGGLLRLAAIPGLPELGEASGTIYIYHTPFLLQPLVIGATALHGAIPQFVGVMAAAAIAIGICYLIHQLLKDTPAKVLLL